MATAQSAPVFAALGDQNRLQLVLRLCAEGPCSITGLTSGSGISRQAVTKHLEVLDRAGLVRGLHRGRERIYEIERKQIKQARRYLRTISQEWDGSLTRLKRLAEEE